MAGEIHIRQFFWEIKVYFDKTEYENRILFHFLKLPDNPKATLIFGISNLLKTAITNLIDNACKFSGHELVDVTLTIENSTICLTISDKGIGILENEISNLFQPFFRASNAYSYKGLGIGLSLAEKIIKLHGGAIDFQSNSAKGTKVDVRFNTLFRTPNIQLNSS